MLLLLMQMKFRKILNCSFRSVATVKNFAIRIPTLLYQMREGEVAGNTSWLWMVHIVMDYHQTGVHLTQGDYW